MLQHISDGLQAIEKFFKEYPFLRDFIIAFAGVVFGGAVTLLNNKSARHKQALFEMQLDILKKEAALSEEIADRMEDAEIVLSHDMKTVLELRLEINDIYKSMVKLNKSLDGERPFVRRYLKAATVEKSAQLVTSYLDVFCIKSEERVFQLKESLNQKEIDKLREIEVDVKMLACELKEAIEAIAMPGIFARIKRKFRKLYMSIEGAFALVRMNGKKKRKLLK